MIYKKLNKIEFILILLFSIILGLSYIAFNFNYLSEFVDEKGDVLTYDYYVRLGIPQFLYNPHHIAFDWIGKVFYNFLQKNGYKESSMVALQMRNLIFTGFSLSIIFFLFYKITRNFFVSLITILLFSFTAGFWIYSQINDTPIIHSLMVFILFLISLYFPQAKNKYIFSLYLGIHHSINIFFHQSDLIMIFVIIFIIFFSENLAEKKQFLPKFSNFKYLFVYLLVFSIIVVVAYYYVGIVLIGLTLDPNKAADFNKIKKSTYFFNWLVLYSKIDYWGKGFEEKNIIPKVITGISTYFYQPQKFNNIEVKPNFENFYSPAHILPNMIVTLIIFVFSFSFIFITKMYKRYNYIFISTFLYMIIYSLFTTWWEADYREFWVCPMFSFWFLLLLILNYINEKKFLFKTNIIIFLYSFLTLLSLLLFYFNFTNFIYKYSGSKFKKFEIISEQYQKKLKSGK